MKLANFRLWLGVCMVAVLVGMGSASYGQAGRKTSGAPASKAPAQAAPEQVTVEEKNLVDGGLDWLETAHPNVQSLSIYCTVAPEKLKVLSKLTKLQSLSIAMNRLLTDADLAMIPRTPALKSLSLSSPWAPNQGPSDEALSKLLGALQLKSLSLSIAITTKEYSKTLDAIGRMSTLTGLYLSNVDYADDRDLQRLGGLRGLTTLRIRARDECAVTDKGLRWIGQQGGLESLFLVNMPKAKGVFMNTLGPSLKQVELQNVGMIDDALRGRWVESLVFLRLDGAQVSAEKVAARLNGSQTLLNLSLEGATITDRFCSAMAGLPKLQTLSVSGLNDQGLMLLAKSASLDSLFVRQSKLTPEGIRRFQGLKPKVSVNLPDAAVVAAEQPKAPPKPAKVTSLRVTDKDLVDGGLDFLEGYADLSSVDVLVTDMQAEKLAALGKVKKLEQLSLTLTRPLTDADLAMIERLGKLKSLSLRAYNMPSGAPHEMSDERLAAVIEKTNPSQLMIWTWISPGAMPRTMEAIGRQEPLTVLSLSLAEAQDKDLAPLSGLKNLEYVSLFGKEGGSITDEGLAWLGTQAKLKKIDLAVFPKVRGTFLSRKGVVVTTFTAYHVGLDDQSIKGGWLSRLDYLRLNKTKVTADGLAAQLPGWSLYWLEYNDETPSENLLKKASECLRLRFVTVTGLDAKGLQVLGRVKAMESITVYGTRITPAEAEKFKKEHPAVKLDSWETKSY